MNNESIYRKRITWLRLIALSPILAFSPLIVGMIGAAFIPGCNESNCAFGALPWYMFMTIPAALVIFVIALIKFLSALQIKLSKAEEPTISEQKLKRYIFAWLGTALSPLALILGFVIFATLAGLSCIEGDCATLDIGYQIPAIIGSAIFVLSWLYLLVVAIWNRFKK